MKMKYQCTVCGYIYDEAVEGIAFNDLPDDWSCPDCGAPKALFEPMVESEPATKEEPITSTAKESNKGKWQCTVCGYIYDEAVEGVAFNDLPDDWSCPDCGAPKALFEPMEPAEATEEKSMAEPEVKAEVDDIKEMSPTEISALFSNLARGCEKQYQEEAQKSFLELADYFKDLAPEEPKIDVDTLASLIKKDLDTNYKNLINEAKLVNDRGTLRITTWGERLLRFVIH